MTIKRFATTLLALLTLAPAVQAGPIPLDLSILANNGFAGDSYAGIGEVSHEATFELISGGIAAQSTVSDVTVNGQTPLSGLLTALGDGIAISSRVRGGADAAADGYYFDFSFALNNSSVLNSYSLSFVLQFDNQTSASGDDSYADSKILLFNAALQEMFFSDLTTDTVLGDQNNGSMPGTFGVSQLDKDSFSFDVLLNAASATSFSGQVKLEGKNYSQAGDFFINSSARLTLAKVQSLNPPLPQISSPATSALFVLGFLLLSRMHRRK